MNWYPNLTTRATGAELMDDAACDTETLFATLDQFKAINRLFSPCHRMIHRHFVRRMLAEPQRQWTLLDVGAGGCDLPIWLDRLARRHGLKLKITCLDDHASVVRYAEQKTATYPAIDVLSQDALALDPKRQGWDFVFTNHFLHHLDDRGVVDAMKRMRSVCRDTFLFCDLRRSRFSYIGFSIVAKLLFDRGFIYRDGQLSIRKGFRRGELQQMVDEALGAHFRVRRAEPAHWAIWGSV